MFSSVQTRLVWLCQKAHFLEVMFVLGLTPLELMQFLRPPLEIAGWCAITFDCGVNYDGNLYKGGGGASCV